MQQILGPEERLTPTVVPFVRKSSPKLNSVHLGPASAQRGAQTERLCTRPYTSSLGAMMVPSDGDSSICLSFGIGRTSFSLGGTGWDKSEPSDVSASI